jgi:acetyl esterase/lipase
MPKFPAFLFVTGLLAITGALAAGMSGVPRLSIPKPMADRQISYGTGPLNIVDLWRPAGKGPFPVVMMIHGGCWQSSIADRSIMNGIAADLRMRGIAVWNIEYRGVDRGGGYPDTYDDVAHAADMLARDGGKLGLDTRRVVVIGHSAGGHLALWLADRLKLPATSRFHGAAMLVPAMIISQGGIPDLRMISALPDHACGNEGAVAMAGRPAHYADTSPPDMVQTDVPQVLVNGDRDGVAPPAFAKDYVAKVTPKGAKVTSITISGSGHFDLIAPESAAWAKQVELIRVGLAAPQ